MKIISRSTSLHLSSYGQLWELEVKIYWENYLSSKRISTKWVPTYLYWYGTWRRYEDSHEEVLNRFEYLSEDTEDRWLIHINASCKDYRSSLKLPPKVNAQQSRSSHIDQPIASKDEKMRTSKRASDKLQTRPTLRKYHHKWCSTEVLGARTLSGAWALVGFRTLLGF